MCCVYYRDLMILDNIPTCMRNLTIIVYFVATAHTFPAIVIATIKYVLLLLLEYYYTSAYHNLQHITLCVYYYDSLSENYWAPVRSYHPIIIYNYDVYCCRRYRNGNRYDASFVHYSLRTLWPVEREGMTVINYSNS